MFLSWKSRMLEQSWEIKRHEKNSLKYFYWYLRWKYTDTFAKIREALQSKIVYKHIVINDFIQVNNRAMFMAIIKHMIERVPFHLKDYSISLKLPSVSPHSVVHFLWEKPNNDSADCQEQLNLKNESKDLSFPSNPEWQKMLSVALHISEIIRPMIFIYGIHVCIKGGFFSFLPKFWFFRSKRGG